MNLKIIATLLFVAILTVQKGDARRVRGRCYSKYYSLYRRYHRLYVNHLRSYNALHINYNRLLNYIRNKGNYIATAFGGRLASIGRAMTTHAARMQKYGDEEVEDITHSEGEDVPDVFEDIDEEMPDLEVESQNDLNNDDDADYNQRDNPVELE